MSFEATRVGISRRLEPPPKSKTTRRLNTPFVSLHPQWRFSRSPHRQALDLRTISLYERALRMYTETSPELY